MPETLSILLIVTEILPVLMRVPKALRIVNGIVDNGIVGSKWVRVGKEPWKMVE